MMKRFVFLAAIISGCISHTVFRSVQTFSPPLRAPEYTAPEFRQDANTAIVPVTSIQNDSNSSMPGRMNVCEVLCPKWCRRVGVMTNRFEDCHFACGNICDGKTANYSRYLGNIQYHVVPIVFEFSRYDLNQDKYVSVEEFAWTEGIPREEAVDLFMFADMDGDGHIEEREFHGGPLVFTVQMAAELSSLSSPKNATTSASTTITPTRV